MLSDLEKCVGINFNKNKLYVCKNFETKWRREKQTIQIQFIFKLNYTCKYLSVGYNSSVFYNTDIYWQDPFAVPYRAVTTTGAGGAVHQGQAQVGP